MERQEGRVSSTIRHVMLVNEGENGCGFLIALTYSQKAGI